MINIKLYLWCHTLWNLKFIMSCPSSFIDISQYIKVNWTQTKYVSSCNHKARKISETFPLWTGSIYSTFSNKTIKKTTYAQINCVYYKAGDIILMRCEISKKICNLMSSDRFSFVLTINTATSFRTEYLMWLCLSLTLSSQEK